MALPALNKQSRDQVLRKWEGDKKKRYFGGVHDDWGGAGAQTGADVSLRSSIGGRAMVRRVAM